MNIVFNGSTPSSLLIIEEDEVESAHLSGLARGMGVNEIHQASSGREALRLLQDLKCPPMAMTVDLEMSEMDGIALIEQLHARGSSVPVALVSGQDTGLLQSVEFMVEQLGLPLLGVLSKPLNPEELEKLLLRAYLVLRRRDLALSSLRSATEAIPTGSELARAITSGQIRAHFQPKVAFSDGHLVGVEALARWTHPSLGEIPPDTFIALAERTGLIHPLTMCILNQAMHQLAQWNAMGLSLSVAVNLSPQLLNSSDLVEEILRIQQQHRISPSQVTLEITESSSAHQFISAIGVLARLRLKGFCLSIDDYGTGYSSMQQLAKIPFKELKFDRSFVQGASRHENHRIILSSSIQMSQKLGLVTVAEGIETEADWQLLKSFGCSVGQGWFIAKPMPADKLMVWIEARENASQSPRLAA